MATVTPTRLTFHPVVALMPAMSPAERAALVEDIRRHGVLTPIKVRQGQILDGRHRYEACQTLGIDCPREEWDGKEPWLLAQSLNLMRRHLPPDQVAAIRTVAERRFPDVTRETAALRAAAATRQHAAGSRYGRGRPKDRSASPETKLSTRTTTTIATPLGISRATLERVNAVERADPTLVDQIAAGDLRATVALRRVQQQAVLARLQATPWPTGQYPVIVIDPPWPYDKRAEDPTHRGATPYPGMSLEAIRALPIPATPDGLLWLWTPNAFMEPAHAIVRGWGFDVKTILTWVKNRMGCGDWLRGQTEHCLLATKGHPTVTPTNQTTVLVAPVREHSRKPAAFYTLVESLCPATPRLELFARETRVGWVSHGVEVDRFVSATPLSAPGR